MSSERTPAPVARRANQSANFNRRDPVLLGVAGTRARPTALVRLPNGRVVRVTRGSRIGREVVVAFDGDRIALRSGSRARWLTIPGR